MVVFTCNHCGESLQKPRVEKHYYTQCRSAKSLTCVDCLKDFYDEDYVAHTKCVTEEERYAAKGSLPNGVVKKGEVKQESWVEMIKSIVDTEKNLPAALRNLLNNLSHHSNVPRKKAKFINFIRNCCRPFRMPDVEAVWDLIETHKEKQKATKIAPPASKKVLPTEEQTVAVENGGKRKSRTDKKSIIEQPDVEQTIPKKKKKKDTSKSCIDNDVVTKDNEAETEVAPTDNIKFSFQEKIMDILKSKGSIKSKKLQKKVINAYLETTGETECTEKTLKKYFKKLKKLDNVEVSDNVVRLVGNAED